jgi:hypothetical protein
MRKAIIGLVSVAVLGLALAAQANTIQIGTGLDSFGGLLPASSTEIHYSAAGPNAENSAIAYVQPFYGGAWVPNQSTGQWISTQIGGVPSQELGNYTYTLTINGVGTMSGNWASDNASTLWVNGNLVATAAYAGSYNSWHPFTANLTECVNTIQFKVNNANDANGGPNPTGLIVYGTADVTPCPDGGLTAMLLGMGLLGLGYVRRMVK